MNASAISYAELSSFISTHQFYLQQLLIAACGGRGAPVVLSRLRHHPQDAAPGLYDALYWYFDRPYDDERGFVPVMNSLLPGAVFKPPTVASNWKADVVRKGPIDLVVKQWKVVAANGAIVEEVQPAMSTYLQACWCVWNYGQETGRAHDPFSEAGLAIIGAATRKAGESSDFCRRGPLAMRNEAPLEWARLYKWGPVDPEFVERAKARMLYHLARFEAGDLTAVEMAQFVGGGLIMTLIPDPKSGGLEEDFVVVPNDDTYFILGNGTTRASVMTATRGGFTVWRAAEDWTRTRGEKP